MTQETAWLDYNKPPPWYRVDEQDDGEWDFGGGMQQAVRLAMLCKTACGRARSGWDWSVGGDVPSDGNAHLITTEDDALAAAWAHYKAERDPPGMWSGQARGEHDGGYGFANMEADHEHPLDADFERIDDARAAAWAWHDSRRAIVLDIDEQTCSGGKHLGAWLSLALAWTDAECTEVETYAALPFPRGIDMPAPLQRVLLPEGQRTC